MTGPSEVDRIINQKEEILRVLSKECGFQVEQEAFIVVEIGEDDCDPLKVV